MLCRPIPFVLFLAIVLVALHVAVPGVASAQDAAPPPEGGSADGDGDGDGEARPRRPRMPRTRAETTEYAETSTLADVEEFLAALQRAGAPWTVTTLGTSTLGRDIPLVIAADPPVASPHEARASGRVVVYVQANIHGGEVEGKEVAQILLRDLATERAAGLLERIVFVVCPIYNVDGNEAFGSGDRNRAGQNGPARVGRRPNGMGLDLNRDCVVAWSPEMRGVLDRVYRRWDPDVVLDLHTTNGTRHGYHLTYSPPLLPDCDGPLLAFARDELLPTVRQRLRKKAKDPLETFPYGNMSRREGAPPGWRTFSPHPRYVTNYAGLRNRIGILSEATSYRDFADRVRSTRQFVRAVLDVIAARADDVLALTAEADARVAAWGADPANAPELGITFAPASRGEETVLLEKAPAKGEGEDGGDGDAEHPTGPPTEIEEVTAPIYDRFVAEDRRSLPAAYAFPGAYPELAALLARHGIRVERTRRAWRGEVSTLTLESVEPGRKLQGRTMTSVTGTWATDAKRPLEVGSYVVRTDQPLALLIFHILEPEAGDGATAWGLLERGLRRGRRHPVWKLSEAPRVAAELVEPDGD